MTARSAWLSGRYYRSPRHEDDYLESWLELWDGKPNERAAARLRLDLRHGRRHLNVGLGVLNTSSAFGNTDYRAMLSAWLDATARRVGPREENAWARPRRRPADGLQPHAALSTSGLLLVGDSAGW